MRGWDMVGIGGDRRGCEIIEGMLSMYFLILSSCIACDIASTPSYR